MKIKCKDCGHSEEVSSQTFGAILGAATSGFGFWAWTSFLFAGTGFAMAICVAIMAGGAAMYKYSSEIVDWLVNHGYECCKCKEKSWVAVSPEHEREINKIKSELEALERQSALFQKNLTKNERIAIDYIHSQSDTFSMEDIEDLLDELEEKDNELNKLLKDKSEWQCQKESIIADKEKLITVLQKRFDVCYSSLKFSKPALKKINRLPESERLKLEVQFGYLQHNPSKAKFRDDIAGTDIKEIEFGNGGRLYVRKEGATYLIERVGNKNSQPKDIKHMKVA